MNYDRLECVTFYVIVQARGNKDSVIGDGGERNTFEKHVEVDLIIQCFSLKVTVTGEEEFKVTLNILAQLTSVCQYQEWRKRIKKK